MSETPTGGDDATGERSPTADAPLRRVLAAADVSLLAAVVERFWEDRGFETARTKRGSHRFLLVRDPAGDPVHLVWLDPTAQATPSHVAKLDRMASSFGDAEATLATGRDYDAAVYRAAEEYGIECLADEQLVTLVVRADLREVVRRHAASTRQNAVADGGATEKQAFELQPPTDHPLAVRAGLVGGGAVLSLMALWGGATEVTARLQACSGGCSFLWVASFLPLLVMLAGSFAVVVGVFD